MLKRIKVFVGFFLLAVALIGLIVPFMPSTPFFIAGVAMVGTDHPILKPWIARLQIWRDYLIEKARYYFPTLMKRFKFDTAPKQLLPTNN